jgi:hypothetical protein
LKDARGQIRAELALVDDAPTLALYDAQGKKRAVLATSGD